MQVISFKGFAQTECAHDFVLNYYKSHDTNVINGISTRNLFLQNYIANHLGPNGYLNSPQPMLTQPINQASHVIPVLIHIIPETNNPITDPPITYAQVESQIDALNAYFNTNLLGANFPTHIQFCLVKNNFIMPLIGIIWNQVCCDIALTLP